MCGIVAEATNPEDCPMTDTEATTWEDALIAQMRAHGGRGPEGPLEDDLLIVLYSTGARTGVRHHCVLTTSRDGDAYVVAGTAGGAPTTPSWVVNVEAHPDIEFELGDQTLKGHAQVIREGPEHDRLWDQHVMRNPRFGAYPEQAGRIIPVVRIVPAEG
jgi:deazaflavin-dependent oxidoreductase (nitroreductase family)